LIALDASLAISIRAWLEVDLGFKKFTIRISFSRSLQLSASVEAVISTEGVGAEVHARVAISAFGCTLSVSIGFTIGGSQLAEARSQVQRFMAMSITAEEPDSAPAVASSSGDKRIESDAKHAEAPAMAPRPEQVVQPNHDASLKPSQFRAQFGRKINESDFWLVLHAAEGDDDCYALLVPREPGNGESNKASFYAAPTVFDPATPGERSEDRSVYRLEFPAGWDGSNIRRWDAATGNFVDVDSAHAEIKVKWKKQIQSEQASDAGDEKFTLAHLFDECFLTDTKWEKNSDKAFRRTLAPWREPPLRRHEQAREPEGATEQERIAARDTVQRARRDGCGKSRRRGRSSGSVDGAIDVPRAIRRALRKRAAC
jgi:hypothetical protein